MSASFRQQVDELISQRDQLSDDAVRRILSLLGELHERVLAQLAARPDLTARDAGALRVEIERLMRQYEQRLATDVSGYQQRAWDLSDDVTDAQLSRAGIRTGIVGVSTETLNIMQGYSATLITSVGEEALRRINTELQLASLGGRSFTELVDNIGRNLDGPSVFGTIATRSEMIARTEVGRAYEMGNTARGNRAAEVLPGLQKTWLHSTGTMPAGKTPRGMYRPRATHVALHRVTIPWNEKFNVGGFDADGPMDASLPAKESVGCLCTKVMDFSALGDPEPRTVGNVPFDSTPSFRKFDNATEGNKWAKDAMGKWQEELTEPELDALKYYQSTSYRRINPALRNKDQDVLQDWSKDIAHIDQALSKGVVPENITTHRFYRGGGADALLSKALNDVFVDPAYVSTSLDAQHVKKWAGYAVEEGSNVALAEIRIPKGSQGGYLEGLLTMRESEILLPRNLPFRILEKSVTDGVPSFVLEIIT